MKNFNDTFLARWIAGEASAEEIVAFKDHPDYEKYLKIKDVSKNLSFSNFDEDKSFSSLKTRLDKKPKKTKVVSLYSWVAGIAACAAIIVGFLFFTQSTSTVYSSPIAQNSTVNLPDGSIMVLNATAEATVDTEKWEDNREVLLKGEAFFKVKKGSKFTVNTSLGNIEVLGTEFTVNTIDDDLLTVKCFEGKVKVISKGNETFLTKGMGYQLNDTNVDSWNFENKSPSWFINNKTILHKTPVKQVVTLIKRQFNLKITDEHLINKNLIFTGSFNNTDLEKALYSVFSVLEVNYSLISENEIRILVE